MAQTQYYADLHSHSNASDGSDTPTQVVERAAAKGLKVLALTDHDTIAGVAEAQAAGEKLGVRVIPGTELTCYAGKKEVHILGYGIDIEDKELAEHCRRFQEARIKRANSISEKLAECGVPIDIDKVQSEVDGVIGRPHVARALVEAGHVKDFQEAFDKYLATGKPACVSKLEVDPKECIDVIINAGGVAVMAHPYLGDQFDLIPEMLEAGCSGVEVWHSSHDCPTSDRLYNIAQEKDIIMSGGSDCHGSIKGGDPLLGKFGLKEEAWKKFESYLKEHAKNV